MSVAPKAIPYLREQVASARALSPEQPGVIRLSCFQAEDILAALDAAERENERLSASVSSHRQNAESLRTACLQAVEGLEREACQDVTRPVQSLLKKAVRVFDEDEDAALASAPPAEDAR